MPSPRKQRLERRQIGAQVLVPTGLTQVAPTDLRNVSALENLQKIALYSSEGVSPTFANGSTTLLSDSVSDATGLWSLGILDGTVVGETSVTKGAFNTGAYLDPNDAIGVFSNSKHYYIPSGIEGSGLLNLSSSSPTGPLIIYSTNGPQAKMVPYYDFATLNNTVSVRFSNQITGSGNPTHVVFYVRANFPAPDGPSNGNSSVWVSPTASAFDILPAKVSSNSFATVIAAGASASAYHDALTSDEGNYTKVLLVPTGSLTGGCNLNFGTAELATYPSPYTQRQGFFVVISSGSYP